MPSDAGLSRPLTVDRRRVVAVLAAVAAAFVAASLLGAWARQALPDVRGVDTLSRLVRINGEGNLPTAFAVSLLLMASGLLVLTAGALRVRGHHDARYWGALGGGFAYLALDEAIQIHERLNTPFRALLGAEGPAFLYFAWVIPGLVVVVLLALVFFRFWWRQATATRRDLAVAAVVFVGGALGVEALGAWEFVQRGESGVYAILAAVEEGAEMAGVILLIRLLLRQLADLGPLPIVVVPPGPE